MDFSPSADQDWDPKLNSPLAASETTSGWNSCPGVPYCGVEGEEGGEGLGETCAVCRIEVSQYNLAFGTVHVHNYRLTI